MNVFKNIVDKVKAYVKEERRKAARLREYRRDCELQLERKCALCKTRECLWTSGYCPN